MATLKPTTRLLTPKMGQVKPASPLCPKTAPKRAFLTRKGDGGFNPPQIPASKGDHGFNPTRARASKGDAGFTREISDSSELWQVLINTHSHAIPPQTLQISGCNP